MAFVKLLLCADMSLVELLG